MRTPTLRSRTRIALGLAALVAAAVLRAPASDAVTATKWKFDVLRLKNRSVLPGLVVEETDRDVRFQHVRRDPGRPTVTYTTCIARREIERLDPLPPDERARLKERLAQLDPTGDAERQRMEQIELTPAD